MKKTVLAMALLIASGIGSYAQTVGPSTINAAGGSGNIGGATYEYAIGEAADGSTLSSSSLVVTQGVLQPASPTAVGRLTGTIAELQVYPSPLESTLYLQPNMGKRGRLEYSLYDAQGRRVFRESAVLLKGNERQKADVHSIAVGQYTLEVRWLEGGNTFVSNYKVQKLR